MTWRNDDASSLEREIIEEAVLGRVRAEDRTVTRPAARNAGKRRRGSAIAVHNRLAFNEVASTCEKAKENEFEMKPEIYLVASASARPREMTDRK